MKLAVTGCGRSGTRYTANLLRAAGLDVMHERFGDDGISDWRLVHFGTSEDHMLFHQVRHPLRAIESLHTFSQWSWGFINAADSRIASSDLRERCMEYWLYWNISAEQQATMTYRVEDIPLQKIIELSGREYREPSIEIPTTTNTRRGMDGLPDLGWQDLIDCNAQLAEEIFKLAEHYGYKEGEI